MKMFFVIKINPDIYAIVKDGSINNGPVVYFLNSFIFYTTYNCEQFTSLPHEIKFDISCFL